MHILPRSLVARTSLLLIVGLAVVEAAGLGIHALDRFDLEERSQVHEEQVQVFSIYRTVAEAKPADRHDAIDDLHIPSNVTVLLIKEPDPLIEGHEIPFPAMASPSFLHRLHDDPSGHEGFPPPGPMDPGMPRPGPDMGGPGFPGPMGPPGGPLGGPPGGPEFHFPPEHPDGEHPDAEHLNGEPRFPGTIRRRDMPPFMRWALLPSSLYPRKVLIGQKMRTHSTSILLPDRDCWLVVRFVTPLPNPFGSPTFMIAFLVMSIAGSAMIVWATQRLIAPVRTLANAAEALGRDVHTAALPENGPSEIRRAAIAFNTMALRIRRFVTDRTLMLTAIGHDLRTPITRLKLRAEFIDDEELRNKVLADLDEMEAMVSATLAFGRDSASAEPIVSLDLRALLQTIMDEAAESLPDKADDLFYEPPHVPVRIKARSVALKRALNNLILNALKYGGNAHVTLIPATHPGEKGNVVKILIEDNGPGLPESELDRVFEPFVRIESSRNRETGGSGLGLSIARTILHGQGGNVRLENRPSGGLRVIVTLAP
ncbi:HAMP domain-containing protein [Gluconobacter sp. LMG 31484]|uniref:histidine kinase n=1 Tax=Gluconobacter vitians TaxID=2728102 RepID=A0ABR9Y3V6_9PROT|nr:ATP-binding protein [Gluconobacter vitians]MBF0858532.1 HAMP domain-containing protein [Gluconobacter vitians]